MKKIVASILSRALIGLIIFCFCFAVTVHSAQTENEGPDLETTLKWIENHLNRAPVGLSVEGSVGYGGVGDVVESHYVISGTEISVTQKSQGGIGDRYYCPACQYSNESEYVFDLRKMRSISPEESDGRQDYGPHVSFSGGANRTTVNMSLVRGSMDQESFES